MSQPSSSAMSIDNPQIKYKKALKQISKLIQANRVLRQSSDKANQEYKDKIEQLALRYDDLEKEYDMVRKQKDSMSNYLDEVQQNQQQMAKQRKNFDRQIGILNDVISQQNQQLKKFHLYKDEKSFAHLIRTYEQKEVMMEKNRNQQEEMINRLKDKSQRTQNELIREKSLRQELQDKHNRFILQINKYKELNSTLMNQNQRILRDHSSKENFTIEKQKQLQLLANQFKRQISNLKHSGKDSSYDSVGNQYNQSYQEVLTQKNELVLELAKIRDAYEQTQNRQRQIYELQQQLKHNTNKAERAAEEVNMLKSKIVVLQAKQFLQQAGEDEYNQREFEERLNIMISQHDPLQSIKNGDDNSHFRILKSFILDLQDKIYKIHSDKKEVSRKYKSIKSKFVKNAQQLNIYEEQNKLLKGKVEGYERLTQKLQYELQKSLSFNQEEITKITLTSHNLITKKSQQYKQTITLLNSQLQMQNQKSDRTQRNLKQEIQTLKLQLGSIRIKHKDLSERSKQDTQFMEMYKKKNDELVHKVTNLQEELSDLNQNISKYQHLLKQEKGKSEGLIIQKQQLNSQVKQLCDQLDRKSYQLGESNKIKEDHYQYELKRINNENRKLKDQYQYNFRQVSTLQREVDERRGRDKQQLQQINRLTLRNRELQENIMALKRSLRDSQDQKQTLKIKASKYQQSFNKANSVEEELMNKNDHINDLKRQILVYENDIKSIDSQLTQEKNQNENTKKELSTLKMKSLQNSHDIKKQYEAKSLQNKRNIQNLNQEISELMAQVREEKTKNSRINNELNTAKSEKNRLQQIIQQNRRKEFQVQGHTGNLKIQLSNMNMDNQKLKSQIKTNQMNINSLNQEIQELQQKIFGLNQEVSGLKMKLQTSQDFKNDLVRDLNALRNHISQVQNYSIKLKTMSNPTWEEQCFTSSLTQIIHKLRKFCRYYDITIENKSPAVSLPVTVNSARKSDYGGHQSQFKSYSKLGGGEEHSTSFNKSPINSPITSTVKILNVSQRSAGKVGQLGQSSSGLVKNFGTSQSIDSGPVDYTYSSSKIGSYVYETDNVGGNVRGTYGQTSEWMNPSYNIGEEFASFTKGEY